MTVQYASDLHLEFSQNKQFLKKHPLKPVGEVLVLAGDVVPFESMENHRDFFWYLSDHFLQTYWIPGNHEYYGFDINKKRNVLNEQIQPNVHLVNNLVIAFGDVRFVFSTLWSRINTGDTWFMERDISDFRLILYGKYRFSVDRFNELHEECLDFLTAALLHPFHGKTLVVSHHVPTLLHYPGEYKNSRLNDAFAVDLSTLIQDATPDFWIYGHHHYNTPEFIIGNTRMVTNQLGYVHLGEHTEFEDGKSIKA